MATHDRRKSATVRDGLLGQPSHYNFYQAVRLLAPKQDPDKTAIEELDRSLQFKSEVGDQFAGSDISAISESSKGTLITLATFGFGGPLGPLPQQHSARIDAEARKGNDALKSFLDLFEHRLISLLYLIKKKYRVGLHTGLRAQSDQYRYLLNVSGLPRKPSANTGCQHAPLMPFSGLLAGGKTSAPSLMNILSTLLDSNVALTSQAGEFVSLDPTLQAQLRSNRSQKLGQNISLGGRIWNQSHGIELEIGPVDWETANSWVPGEDRYAKLVDLLLYITNGQWRIETIIKVEESTIPNSELNRSTRLGFNSWLKTTGSDDSVKLTRRTIKPTHFH